MTENPVLRRELRSRLRSRKTRTVRLAVGIPAAAILIISYYQIISAMLRNFGRENGEVWSFVSFLQLVLICFIVPGLTANSISQEKEQRTWGLLLITRLSPWQIIWGKLAARLASVPLLLLIFVPFQVYSAAASDMPAYKVVWTYLILFSCVIFFAVQGAFWSWLARRTSVAISAAYGTVFALAAGTGLIEMLIQLAGNRTNVSAAMWFNPFYAMDQLLTREEAWSVPGGLDIVRLMCAAYVAVGIILLIVMKNALERNRTE